MLNVLKVRAKVAWPNGLRSWVKVLVSVGVLGLNLITVNSDQMFAGSNPLTCKQMPHVCVSHGEQDDISRGEIMTILHGVLIIRGIQLHARTCRLQLVVWV